MNLTIRSFSYLFQQEYRKNIALPQDCEKVGYLKYSPPNASDMNNLENNMFFYWMFMV